MNTSTVPSAIEALDRADIAVADSQGCGALLAHLRVARGWLDAVEARVTSRMTELYETAGAAPAVDQHTRSGGVSAAEGRRKERRSKTIDTVPAFGDALAGGSIGAEHVDALASATANLENSIAEELFTHAADLLAEAERTSPEQFGRSVRGLARHLERDHGIERNRRQRHATFLSRKINAATGMVEGRYAFHPELANQVFGAVDRDIAAMVKARVASGDDEFVRRTYDRNRLAAEALGRLVAGGHQQVRPLEADITLVVDARTAATGELHDDSICETGDGLELPPASVRRLLCGGRITPIIVDPGGNVLNAGRTIRHANRSQRRALRAMYRTCAFHGCDTVFDRCEIHHIHEWEHGGSTDLANLVPLRLSHEPELLAVA